MLKSCEMRSRSVLRLMVSKAAEMSRDKRMVVSQSLVNVTTSLVTFNSAVSVECPALYAD